MAPRYERLARDWPHVTFAEVSLEDNTSLVKALKIRTLPTVRILSDGETVESMRLPARLTCALEEKLQQHCAEAPGFPVHKLERLEHVSRWTRRWQQHRWRRARLWERPLATGASAWATLLRRLEPCRASLAFDLA